jgi:4-amino-4-deoxy-L-arabinose transferase-like glycosyltransferase
MGLQEAFHMAEQQARIERVLDACARRPLVVLALLCLCLWLPALVSVPPLDRDESRFAQSSKQMLESGDFVDIRFGHVPRYKKPVGIYWLQAATTAIAGSGQRDRIWTYRLASLLGGIAAAWLTFWCARAFASPRTSLVAAVLLSSTLLTSVESIIATTDAVLLACTLGAQTVLMRAYLAHGVERPQPLPLWLALAGWIALGLSVLVKGPIALGVCAVTALALSVWDRNARWLMALRPVTGMLVAVLVVAPWAIAIALESHGAFYEQSLGHDFAAKLASGQESHGAPPGYYLALVTLTFWPATLFLLPALRDAIAQRTQPAIRFLLAWTGAAWVMFEAVPTKLPHYILPVYPALAMLAAIWVVDRSALTPLRGWRIAGLIQFALGAALLTGAAIVLPDRYGNGANVGAVIMDGIALIYALIALVLVSQRQMPPAVIAVAASALFLFWGPAADAPNLQTLWVSPRLDASVVMNRHAGDPPIISAGFAEPSLVFLLGTNTELTDGVDAADMSARRGGLVLIEDHERDAFLTRLATLEGHADAVGQVSGLNYSRGRHVHVTVYRVTTHAAGPH